MAERPDVLETFKRFGEALADAQDYIDTLKARLKAATERCSVQIDLGPCHQCRADLALLDTPEPTDG